MASKNGQHNNMLKHYLNYKPQQTNSHDKSHKTRSSNLAHSKAHQINSRNCKPKNLCYCSKCLRKLEQKTGQRYRRHFNKQLHEASLFTDYQDFVNYRKSVKQQ